MKIVALVGSPRANGNTSYLTDQALVEASKLGIETEKIVLTQYQVSPCQGHDECQDFASCPQKDDTESIVQKLYEADGVIFASPVYFLNVTAQLKAFIDRNRFYRRHNWRIRAKCVGTIVVAGSSGVEDATGALVRFVKASSNIPAEQVLRVYGLARTQWEIKGNAAVVEEARRLGRRMAEELLAR